MDMLVKEIVAREWELFDKVQNRGGRAACQDDKRTFEIMRTSQLEAWSVPMRESWRQDLEEAARAGRNPMSEKYGYMMARTSPAEYAQISHLLPLRSEEKDRQIEFICQAHVMWQEKTAAKYPRIAVRGRPIRKEADTACVTSLETYLWGELATYSAKTLQLYYDYVRELLFLGRNLCEMILQNTAAHYGYESLAQAENAV